VNTLILVKVVFVVACAVVAMVVTVKTARTRRLSRENIHYEYAMPRVIGYGVAALFGILALNELGHLIALVRG
jgi:hypothetical protein